MSTDPVVIEYKIANGLPWEHIEVWARENFTPTDPIAPANYARTIANLYEREVRWNLLGSQQGHYVQPEAENVMSG